MTKLSISDRKDLQELINDYKNGKLSTSRFRAFIIGLYNPYSRFTFEYNAFNEYVDSIIEKHLNGAPEILNNNSSGSLYYGLTDTDY